LTSANGMVRPRSCSAPALPISHVGSVASFRKWGEDVRSAPDCVAKSPTEVCGIGICNNQIRLGALLNLCCGWERHLESILRAGVLKIALQHNWLHSDQRDPTTVVLRPAARP